LSEFQGQGIGLSLVSLAELWEGVLHSSDVRANERHLRNFLRGIRLIGIDQRICKIFGKECGRLRAEKKNLGDFDLLIGATALRHGLVLLTNNRRHFRKAARITSLAFSYRPLLIFVLMKWSSSSVRFTLRVGIAPFCRFLAMFANGVTAPHGRDDDYLARVRLG
jgi:tRNA(fMet)-specific endonuclease VapC